MSTPTRASKNVAQKKPKDRACDGCRRRKLRCEVPKGRFLTLASAKCTNCASHSRPCTFERETSRPPAPRKAYVTCLEQRLEYLEAVLQRFEPDKDYSYILGPPIVIGSWETGQFKAPKSRIKPLPIKAEPELAPLPSKCSTHLIFCPPKDESTTDDESSEEYNSLIFDNTEQETLIDFFHGASTRKAFTDAMRQLCPEKRRYLAPQSFMRPEFWTMCRWKIDWWGSGADVYDVLQAAAQRLPAPDLADSLFDLYFERVNVTFPFLHRASMMRKWANGEQYYDKWFACACLGLFGIASRWSDDPRVLPEDEDRPKWTRSGWSYYRGAMGIIESAGITLQPTLHEVQGLLLTALFLTGTDRHTTGWLLINIAVRKCVSIGAQLKSSYSGLQSVETELWKRAVWMLTASESVFSASLGQSPGLGEEDFNIPFPCDVDDEYWENTEPSKAFCQPTGIRPRTAVFNHWSLLMRIAAFALKTIYAVNTKCIYFEKFMPSMSECARQCTEAMKTWFKDIPVHLTWSENIEDLIESNHSAWLHASYCFVEMLIYRPFIPSPSATSSCGSRALEICINAATATAHIFDHQMKRGYWEYSNLMNTSEVGAAILIIGIWDVKKKSNTTKSSVVEQLMANLHVFFRALKGLERRFEVVTTVLNRLRDSLPTELQHRWQGYDSSRTYVHPTTRLIGQPDEYVDSYPAIEPHRGGAAGEAALEASVEFTVEATEQAALQAFRRASTTNFNLRTEAFGNASEVTEEAALPAFRPASWTNLRTEAFDYSGKATAEATFPAFRPASSSSLRTEASPSRQTTPAPTGLQMPYSSVRATASHPAQINAYQHPSMGTSWFGQERRSGHEHYDRRSRYDPERDEDPRGRGCSHDESYERRSGSGGDRHWIGHDYEEPHSTRTQSFDRRLF
ncbi:fungal-specific transcription factor domain-containing protein [Mycena floridula]|nr:fungal-specific transcription factor domain-containing protein [Mycena floridula]